MKNYSLFLARRGDGKSFAGGALGTAENIVGNLILSIFLTGEDLEAGEAASFFL